LSSFSNGSFPPQEFSWMVFFFSIKPFFVPVDNYPTLFFPLVGSPWCLFSPQRPRWFPLPPEFFARPHFPRRSYFPRPFERRSSVHRVIPLTLFVSDWFFGPAGRGSGKLVAPPPVFRMCDFLSGKLLLFFPSRPEVSFFVV